MKLAFQCVQAAQQGGETPLADMLRVTRRMGEERMERFTRLGVLYVRNYGQPLDLPWQTVFQTQDRAEVERYCREHGLEAQWLSGGRLRTRQVCQGTAVHPVTGERVWFNQAHLFHITSLDPKTREALLELFREDELPRQTYLGDGTPLAPEELDAIREAFTQEEVAFPWQAGDVLLVDNMQVAHGRRPFSGPRKVLVAMADPHSPSWPPAGMREAGPGKS
jgi:alpha-ketoglutarate-dependent taurine dioxygenase